MLDIGYLDIQGPASPFFKATQKKFKLVTEYYKAVRGIAGRNDPGFLYVTPV